MKTKELIEEIEELFRSLIGMQMYAVIKADDTNEIKLVNIRDDGKQNANDQTEDDLMAGFINVIRTKFYNYREDEPILPLSSADERKNGLFYYDLDVLPREMDYLKKVDDTVIDFPIFSIDNDGLDKIEAFIIVIGNAESRIVLYKQQYPISLLKKDRCMLTPVPHKNRLKKYESDILRIDFNYQFFLWNGKVYISDINKMEKICSFYNIIVHEAQKSIEAIQNMDILDDIESLNDELENISFARKLTRIQKDSKVLGKVSNDAIIKFTQTHSYFEKNPLKLNAEGNKFVLDTKKSKNIFIKLMNDDLLTSYLTNSEYEALAKNMA